MNLLSLYHFFAGKASDKQKEAIKRWAESSPDNYETLCREKKIFDAGILLVDKKELSQKENAPLLYSRPLKSAHLRNIVRKQYPADFFNKPQKSPHGSFEVVCGGS